MNPRRPRLRWDWRRLVVYTHRWLGIGGCLLFIVWFASGIVMMYARMPGLTSEERLARLPALDFSRARVSPADAIGRLHLKPSGIRVGMFDGRPIYRVSAGRRITNVFADTGEELPPVSAEAAVDIARRFYPAQQATITYDTRLLDSDQWTLSGSVRSLMPLHRLNVGDQAGTVLYVAESTGEPVLKTTATGRLWGFFGAVLHWIYFTPFRRHATLWAQSIIWLSIAGCVMCLSGIVWGVWRYSPISRYRLKRVAQHSPYAGMMLWHHYAGLLFGLTTFTWILSGLLSMDPWDWHPDTSPTRQQRERVSGGALRTDLLTLERLRTSIGAFSSSFMPKEVEVLQLGGEPFLMAYHPPVLGEEYELGDRRLVSVVNPGAGMLSRFADDRMLSAGRAAMPGVSVTDSEWLSRYDAYYYDRHGALPLPVLRVRFGDPEQTWLYLDPFSGAIARKEERWSRVNRWLYHGLHSFDFPFLYYRRPLWDLVLIVLSIGGLASTITTLLPAAHRLRRHARRLSSQRSR